jgi:sigma-E factor negative regulatory protein RseB
MWSKLSAVPVATLLLSLTAPVLAGADAGALLVGMSEAARGVNYQGVIVYQSDGALETMRVTHRFAGGVERERIQSLTGEPREILKQDSKVTCLLPKDRKLTMQRPTPKGIFLGLTPERVQQISQVYEFADLGESRIAGRLCRGVRIQPRDEHRYGYEVWADDKTRVPLKVNLVANDGRVLEQMMFTEVDFPASIPDSALQTTLDSRQYREVTRTLTEMDAQPAAASASWHFDRLPVGYRVTMRDLRPLGGGQGTVEHLLLSDGLSAISVFTARRDVQSKPFTGLSQMGAVNAYGRMIGRVHVTVVGEAPEATVKLIGDNVRPAAADEADAQPTGARK